jgi:hypothetical protein
MNRLCSVLLSALVWSSFADEYFSDFSVECDQWAERDGECVNNYTFMWSKCTQSCINTSSDDNDMCGSWADEGECTNNPSFIQVHCPRSCKLAIVWNPWTRNTLGDRAMSTVPVFFCCVMLYTTYSQVWRMRLSLLNAFLT